MARDFIKIDTGLSTQKFAGDLINAIRAITTNREDWIAIKDKMSHMNDGTTFTDIETYFGLPAGTGSGALSIVTGIVTALDSASVVTVTSGRVG